eukprot:gene13173-15183_t
MFSEQVDCLIVGAGPTGLALGVGLMRSGKSVLIVEKHEEALDFSRAILLNSEVLTALDSYHLGIVERLQESGILIDGISFHVNGNIACSAQFDTDNTNRNHPIAVPQKVTESCLQDVFREMGGRLIRGVTFSRVQGANSESSGGGSMEVLLHTDEKNVAVKCDWLFGCDGLHSAVREDLQIPFPGVSLPEKLFILDAIVKSWSLPTHVNGFLARGEALFVILISAKPLTVRIIGTTRAACSEILEKFEVQVIWDGSFTNSFRLADSYGRGHIWLAGDAAHVHSPVGGRGMNMGILDAVQLARAVANDSVHRYEETRRPAARTWVWCNYYLTQLIMSNSLMCKWLRVMVSYGLVVLGYLLGARLAKMMFEGMTTAQVPSTKDFM